MTDPAQYVDPLWQPGRQCTGRTAQGPDEGIAGKEFCPRGRFALRCQTGMFERRKDADIA